MTAEAPNSSRGTARRLRVVEARCVSHAAAHPLLRAAGGCITPLDGSDAGDEDEVRIASNSRFHEELLDILRGLQPYQLARARRISEGNATCRAHRDMAQSRRSAKAWA